MARALLFLLSCAVSVRVGTVVAKDAKPKSSHYWNSEFHWNAQTPSELFGSRQLSGPLPQGLVGILNLGLPAPPSGGPSSFVAWRYITRMLSRSRSSRGRPRNAPAAFMTRSHFGHIPVILVAVQVSARNGAALMRWSLSYHKARS